MAGDIGMDTTSGRPRKKVWLFVVALLVAATSLGGLLLIFVEHPTTSTTADHITTTADLTRTPERRSMARSTQEVVNMTRESIMDGFLANLPDYTLESLEDPISWQSKALHWCTDVLGTTDDDFSLEDPIFFELPTWRQTQVFAMATLYYSLEGSRNGWPREYRFKWADSRKNVCQYSHFGANDDDDWIGVECFGNAVNTITLRGLTIRSDDPAIPPEIGLLSKLTDIGVEDCTINATLSDFIGRGLARLSTLQTLSIRKSPFLQDGALPSEIGLASQLARLEVYRSELKGTIPSELGLLSRLTSLYLVENELSGSIPEELIGVQSKLRSLILNKNSLTGPVPESMWSSSELASLYIEDNFLQGTLPAGTELGQMTRLSYLSLNNNSLSGTLPTSINMLQGLESLNIGRNKLVGSIHTEWKNMSSLCYLMLNDNAFEEQIPSELGELPLSELDLSSNSLSGSIPIEIYDYPELNEIFLLYLNNNSLVGSLPTGIGKMNLQLLRLQGNRMTGALPSELGLLRYATQLQFGDNSFTGSLPTELGLLRELSEVNVTRNNLSGGIPLELQLVSTLQILDLSENPLLTESTSDLGDRLAETFSLMGGHLNIHDTGLYGTIPTELCWLQDGSSCALVWPSFGPPDQACALIFDCSAQLCGCDCAC